MTYKFKVDRLLIIVVAKKYIYVSQLFISRMPKMRTIPQLVSVALNAIPIAEHFRRSHPPCEHSFYIQNEKVAYSTAAFDNKTHLQAPWAPRKRDSRY